MHRDDPGELGRVADDLFHALDRLVPDGHPTSVDLSRCDALTAETDTDHLVLHGKLCAQRLYRMDWRRPDHDQDAVIVLVSALDLVVRSIVQVVPSESGELRRLIDEWERLQNLTMELERHHAAREA